MQAKTKSQLLLETKESLQQRAAQKGIKFNSKTTKEQLVNMLLGVAEEQPTVKVDDKPFKGEY